MDYQYLVIAIGGGITNKRRPRTPPCRGTTISDTKSGIKEHPGGFGGINPAPYSKLSDDFD
ncbi:hypothetical protein HH1059_08710 [Halorhodospira halochloris]|uniref:Uncharacterized protein n=1 Tax=Halorhodospira halochloris TaxID=1052 RepID=A0A2Z6EZH5_HALHR|nr:hypothetical protein HH1059_08710 [Halorhodospira halochloris]